MAIPGKIIEINDDQVKVDYDGDIREAVIIDGEFVVGDFVIVQGKIVVDKVPNDQIKKWQDFINEVS